jgi:hypothetical protein
VPGAVACVAFAQEIPDMASEVRQLKAALSEQRSVIEALRTQLNAQQALLERMTARTEVQALSDSVVTNAFRPASPSQNILPRPAEQQAETPSPWYERINLRGYVQTRYNGLAATNPDLTCEQCDRAMGGTNGISIRRARMVFSGDISNRVYLYFQPDFAATAGGLHFGQLRDLYFDVSLDKAKEFRIRVGQSKVPFGFENLQSSQNRLALDRNDALNSAVVNERDLGIYLMYAPRHIRQRFKYLVDSGLKGSGDYGVLAVGAYNGQNANRPEANGNLHRLVRFAYPMQLRNGQFIEAGIQAFTGQYTVQDRGASTIGPTTLSDRRVAVSLIAYPQPFGFQAEYNWGTGPEYTPAAQTIGARALQGGYVQLMHRQTVLGQALTTFFKSQYYGGGKKYEFDARRYIVRQNELGLEWQFNPLVELTTVFTRADRTYEDSRSPNNRQRGSLLRLQLQFNY